MKKLKLDPLNVAHWLQDLTDQQFITFFNEHLSERHIYRSERRYLNSHLVLANAVRGIDDDKGWRLQVLCPTPGQDWVADAPVCQFGTHCGFETASVSKVSQCPICGDEATGS
jgi:hypothetical protein